MNAFEPRSDSSSGTLMACGLVDRIVVGADRVAANGDAIITEAGVLRPPFVDSIRDALAKGGISLV